MNKFKFNRETDKLFEAILNLKNVKEAEDFFRDLCTVDEIKDMTERWQIVQSVEQSMPYREIAKKLNVSTTTVSRVAFWLNNGTGGYKNILDRTNSHHTKHSKIVRGG